MMHRNWQYTDRETLRLLADKSWRGTPNSSLVYFILDTKAKLDLLEIDPDEAIGFKCPSDCSKQEWIESHRHFWECQLDSATKEIERRRTLNEKTIKAPDREIIQAIKNSLHIEDVIESYTEVIVPRGGYRGNWRFRCTLHGQDNDPSGVIYRDEGRWWCFGCNKGGDIYDAVQMFERVDLPTAIKKLATQLGIELRPLVQRPKPVGKGGAICE